MATLKEIIDRVEAVEQGQAVEMAAKIKSMSALYRGN